MATIDLTVDPDRLERTLQRARERNILIPTFAQMKNPALIPAEIRKNWTDRAVGCRPAQPVPHHLEE